MNEDLSGFESWYTASYPAVYRAALAYSWSVPDAADACDEAFVRAYARWDSSRRPSNPTAWTATVALNLLRRPRRWLPTSGVDRPDPSPGPSEHSEHLHVRRAVERLPPKQRRAVILRYFHDLPQADIASEMGIADGTVAATLSHARSNLRVQLEERE
jgi:RNA polymerase sigma-70 factor (ECF subfamily)